MKKHKITKKHNKAPLRLDAVASFYVEIENNMNIPCETVQTIKSNAILIQNVLIIN